MNSTSRSPPESQRPGGGIGRTAWVFRLRIVLCCVGAGELLHGYLRIAYRFEEDAAIRNAQLAGWSRLGVRESGSTGIHETRSQANQANQGLNRRYPSWLLVKDQGHMSLSIVLAESGLAWLLPSVGRSRRETTDDATPATSFDRQAPIASHLASVFGAIPRQLISDRRRGRRPT